MTERKNPTYLYYNTTNDSYIPQMRAAGIGGIPEPMPYGKGAYLSVSPNATMGIDYTLTQESDWKEADCVRLGNEYYTMDKFAEYVASVIKTDNINLIKKTLELIRKRDLGEIPHNTNLYEKLSIIPSTNIHKESQRIVDALIYSFAQSYCPNATRDEFAGFTFETRDVLSGFYQTFRVDASTLADKVKHCDGIRTLEQQRCLKKHGPLGSFLKIYGIGDIDRVGAGVCDDQEMFIDKAHEFIDLISRPSAVLANIDPTNVTENYKNIVNMLQEHVKHNPQGVKEIEDKLAEYETLLTQRKLQQNQHKKYYDLIRQGISVSPEMRKQLPTIPEMRKVRESLVKISKELVTHYITKMPLADVYRSMTEKVSDKDLPERIDKIREVFGFDSFEAPVLTRDMTKPSDMVMNTKKIATDGKTQLQPNKAMEIQMVLLTPDIITPTHRMGVDTKGKWEEIPTDSIKSVSKTSVTRLPKKILAGLDGTKLFIPLMIQGDMHLIANEEALTKLSAKEQMVLGRLFEIYRVDFENIGTEAKPIGALKKESIPNFQSAMKAIRRAKLESKNLPRGVVTHPLGNSGR